jgi:hypothetical protein
MQNDWFRTDVPRIIAETKLIYQRLVEKYPDKTLEATTIQKIIQERHWEESLPIYEGRFRDVVTRLGCLYIPKLIIPGPAFIFPMRSADGTYPRAQTKPLEGSALWSVDGKYQYVGDKEKYIGPNWLGNDPETIRQIIETQSVMCVEGPFDLLAMRLICPSFPIMSPLTKKVGKNHIAYLRILGVKRLLLMYDNEIQGEESMEQQRRNIKVMQVITCECTKKDPSKALEKYEWARDLQSRTAKYFEY